MTDKTILVFGDSNTYGSRAKPFWEDSRRFPKAERWPTVMAHALGPGFEVIAEGHPGRNAAFDDPIEGAHKNAQRILPALLQSHGPVDLLIILLGTNDLKARFSASAIDIALGLETLAIQNRTYLCGPGGTAPKLLFVAPVPVEEVGDLGEIFAGGAAKSRALPPLLQKVAARQGAAFLDLASVAQVDMVDGVHLSAEAQAAVGRAVAAKVVEIFAA